MFKRIAYTIAAAVAAAPLFSAFPAHAAGPTGNAFFDSVTWVPAGGGSVNETADLQDADANDVQLAGTAGSKLIIAAPSKFSKISINITTAGVGGVVVWEYMPAGLLGAPDPYAPLTLTTNTAGNFTSTGIKEITFTPPADWASGEGGYYFVRVRTVQSYAAGMLPLAGEGKGTIYNVHVILADELSRNLSGPIPDYDLPNCTDTTLYGVLSPVAGDGVYQIAVGVPAAADADCSFRIMSDDYLHTTATIGTPTTNVVLPNLELRYRTKVFVQDEMGNDITGATVTHGGFAPAATDGTGGYFWGDVGSAGTVRVVRSGYVTNLSDGSADAQLLSVNPGSSTASTWVYFDRATPCGDGGSVAAGATVHCTALQRDYTMTVRDSVGAAVQGATVTMYVDAARTILAENGVPGSGAATGATDASGRIEFALASGTYFTKATKAGYNDATGSITVESGILHTDALTLTTAPVGGGVASAARSWVDAVPSTVTVDGAAGSTVTVQVADTDGFAVAGATVTVSSSLAGSSFAPAATATTNASGQAAFTIRSSAAGTATISATANGTRITDTAAVVFTSPAATPPPVPVPVPDGRPAPGSLIKLACPPNAGVNDPCKEVSSVGTDGARHSFPNQAVFFTWFPAGFSSVTIQTITPSVLVSFPLGRNVTHKPGVKLVKSPTNPRVYAVTKGDGSFGWLREVTSPEIAATLYGPAWARSVTDFSDVFMVNSYRVGTPIINAGDYNPTAEQAANATIDASMGL